MERQAWLPKPLEREKPSKRKIREEEDDEEPDISELLDWIEDILDIWDYYFDQGTCTTGGGG